MKGCVSGTSVSEGRAEEQTVPPVRRAPESEHSASLCVPQMLEDGACPPPLPPPQLYGYFLHVI